MRSGKTLYIIMQSAVYGIPIMTGSKVNAEKLKQFAAYIGVKIPEPIVLKFKMKEPSINQSPGPGYAGLKIWRVIYDERTKMEE